MTEQSALPVLALTQGDPAGIGPELLLRVLAARRESRKLLLIAESAALDAVAEGLGLGDWRSRCAIAATAATAATAASTAPIARDALEALPEGGVAFFDPVGEEREVAPGVSGPADAAAAMACLDTGIDLARRGIVDALVTAPVSKSSIASHVDPEFRGHTDYLAQACGLERYGADYLMAFLTPKLQVALLTTHIPLRQAVESLDRQSIVNALICLGRHAGGRIAVAGLDPHAGEGGLLGSQDEEVVRPAVDQAKSLGLDVHGPLSADSLFARARDGEFDWVLALYHDQGLIPVKTLSFGSGTNWTLGLPFLRTSVDHGTAFELAGRGKAKAEPLLQVLDTTGRLIRGELPRHGAGRPSAG